MSRERLQLQKDARFKRLPQWAQQEITRLERDVEYYSRQLKAGPEDSNTFADPSGTQRPLGTNPIIEFCLADGARVRVRVDGDALDVSAIDRILHVFPRTSNSVELKADRRW